MDDSDSEWCQTVIILVQCFGGDLSIKLLVFLTQKAFTIFAGTDKLTWLSVMLLLLLFVRCSMNRGRFHLQTERANRNAVGVVSSPAAPNWHENYNRNCFQLSVGHMTPR